MDRVGFESSGHSSNVVAWTQVGAIPTPGMFSRFGQ
jgi:hypothetical protein